MNLDKETPKNEEVESVVLGTILLEPRCLIDIDEIITEDSFFKNAHKVIFTTISEMFKEDRKIDLVTVGQRIHGKGKIEEVGGLYYLTTLTERVASSAHIDEHCLILKQFELQRKQIDLGNEIIRKAYNNTSDPFETNHYIEKQISVIAGSVEMSKEKSNVDLLVEINRSIENAKETEGVIGVETGFKKQDRLFGGYREGNLIIKAARPGMGKTAHGLAEAIGAAKHRQSVLFFSLEMSALELMKRLLSIEGTIENWKIDRGELDNRDHDNKIKAERFLQDAKIKIVDDIFTFNGIKNKARREAIKGNADIVFIDYLQLVGHHLKNRNRENEVSEISRGLKLLAKQINAPVVCISQLSRAVDQRGGDKKPILSDLRESGSIEQDADIVQFLYRPEYYGFTEDEDGNSMIGKGLLIVAKNRGGSLHEIPMNWNAPCTKFTDIDSFEETKSSLFDNNENF